MGFAQEKNKLTLWLDKETISFGKRFAKTQDKSLSELFREYLQALRKNSQSTMPVTATVKSMTGVVRGKSPDEKDYHRHLEEKHRHA